MVILCEFRLNSRSADGLIGLLPDVSGSTALLQSQKLLRSEGLVVDLRGRLNQVLQVGASEEVSEGDELAMALILNIDDAPSVLTTTDLLAANEDRLL